MKLGDQYECGHLPGEILTVTKKYSGNMAVVTSDKTGSNIMCSSGAYEGPMLSLAHVFKDDRLLKKKEKQLW